MKLLLTAALVASTFFAKAQVPNGFLQISNNTPCVVTVQIYAMDATYGNGVGQIQSASIVLNPTDHANFYSPDDLNTAAPLTFTGSPMTSGQLASTTTFIYTDAAFAFSSCPIDPMNLEHPGDFCDAGSHISDPIIPATVFGVGPDWHYECPASGTDGAHWANMGYNSTNTSYNVDISFSN